MHQHQHASKISTKTIRRSMQVSTLDGIFGVQYVTLTGGSLLTAFLLALGATKVQIGLVAALPLLGGLLQPIGAEVIRRKGGWRRSVCLRGALVDALLWSVSFGAILFLELPTALLVVLGVLVLQQVAGAFVGIAWTSWISDLVPTALRGRFFGRRNFICNALGAATAVLAGQIVSGADRQDIPAFLGLIAVGVLMRLVSIYYLSRQPEPLPARSTSAGFWHQLRQPLLHEGFRRYVQYAVAWGFSVNLAAPFFTVYMLQEAQVSVGTVMLFAAFGTLANLLGQRLWGPLSDRYGDYQVVRVASLIVGLQPLWWLFTGPTGLGFYLMGVLSFVGGFAWGGYALATGNLMMRLAPEVGKTVYFAVQAALAGLFGALGPLVGGALASILQEDALLGTSALGVGGLLDGLKALFFVSFVLRMVSWQLLRRVPSPVRKPRLRAAYIIRDAVRTFNPTQGFSPLLHVFVATRDKKEQ